MNDRALIFAGTHDEAEEFAALKGLTLWKYIASSVLGRGRMDPVVYLVGTYRERGDYQEVMHALLPMQPTFLDADGPCLWRKEPA
jgi:hypothetical protein